MPQLQQSLKNEYTKRFLRRSGLRPPQQLPRTGTGHYRMPMLENNGGWLALGLYSGPEIAPEEWESLTYTTYATDPLTYFAPITSATGSLEMAPSASTGSAIWTASGPRTRRSVRRSCGGLSPSAPASATSSCCV